MPDQTAKPIPEAQLKEWEGLCREPITGKKKSVWRNEGPVAMRKLIAEVRWQRARLEME